ncbi:MAG: alanine--tRNA ligase, partial [Nanoarchaeota archaeon]|nr:alanine--tRNA ligase [Nanoarchaeota archaeon]
MKWNRDKLVKKYVQFFKKKGHKEIANASLIPENDPTVLFTTAGMHPLVPFLLGEKHPAGKRLVSIQRCIRTVDIGDVGDEFHMTFFEMLGNWSLGDYFKKEAVEMSYEFLTKVLGFDAEKLCVTVFEGDKDAPRDEESVKAWSGLGIPKERIFYLGKKDNWWGPAGEIGPCGPDTEIFYDSGKKRCGKDCKPGCGCGKYVEVWNNVFMEYEKKKDGSFVLLKQKNVDTGMGVERTVAMLNGFKSVYEIEEFALVVEKIRRLAKKYDEASGRIIADHITAAVFILGDEKGVAPSNLGRGYVLRRLIRGAIRRGELIGVKDGFCADVAEAVIDVRGRAYLILKKKKEFILDEIKKEEEKFRSGLSKGLRKFENIKSKKVSGREAFLLFSSYGFPVEMTIELAKEKGMSVDIKGFEKEFKKHQEISRAGAEKKFKSGLADTNEETKKLHTVTHLLHAALRKVLGSEVEQRGSNITRERLRFDFNFERKMSDEEIKKVENLVNKWISRGLKVVKEEMSVGEARKKGAIGLFEEKYDGEVSVYSIGDVSCEMCAGPHIGNTRELGVFKIVKEESSAAG